MNKIIVGIGAAVIVFTGLVWIAQPNMTVRRVSVESRNQVLTVNEANNYDFGKISMSAGKVSHIFKIKNTGNEPVTINKIYTSCMCTIAILTSGDKKFGPFGMLGHGVLPKVSQSVGPNEEISVEVVFDPAAHGPAGVGRISRTVTLENNVGRPVELLFAAIVTP